MILDKPITTLEELRANPGVAELAFERDTFRKRWEDAAREVAELREALSEALALAREANALVEYDPGALLDKRISEMSAAYPPHAQGGTPNERSSEGTNRRGSV